MSDRQVAAEAAKRAAKLDPASVVRRRAKAEADRRVTIRPAPDTMTYLTGLLPMAKGVSVYAALTQAADALKSGGDPRSRGQIMADILVARITGQDDASRSEEHTSELQSLMRISYAVCCLKKKNTLT